MRNADVFPKPASTLTPSEVATATRESSLTDIMMSVPSSSAGPQPQPLNSCDLSSPSFPMASALHCLQCLIILISRPHRSMSSFLSWGVGALLSENLVPSTGIRGSMLTM